MDTNHTDLEKLLKEDLELCNKEHDLLQIKSKYLGLTATRLIKLTR